MDELTWTIKKLKRNKASGPDEIPVDCCKEMSKAHLAPGTHIWTAERLVDRERNRTISYKNKCHTTIRKQETTHNLANYRPISLLSTKYKHRHSYYTATIIGQFGRTLTTDAIRILTSIEHCTNIALFQTCAWKWENTSTTTFFQFCMTRLGKALDMVIHE